MTRDDANNPLLGPVPDLGRFRSYLMVLARARIGVEWQGKLDASDVVQQALLTAHRQQDEFRGIEAPQVLAWLRRILAGTLADAFRHLGRDKRDAGRERSLEAALEQSADRLSAWLAADQSSPSEHLDRAESACRLADALDQLPDAQRTALVLRYCEGWSVADISRQMGRTPVAVAGLLKRGTQQLRERLGETT